MTCLFLLFFFISQDLATEASLDDTATFDIVFRNPFKSALPRPQETQPVETEILDSVVEETKEIVEPIITAPSLTITGLIWDTDRPQAIVNNQVVDVGDIVEQSQIVKISRTGIDVIYQGKQFTISQDTTINKLP